METDEYFVPSTADLRFQIDKAVFLSTMERVLPALSPRAVPTVLRNFKVVASGKELSVTAGSMLLSMVTKTSDAEIMRPGKAVLPGRRIIDLIREAEDGKVDVDISDGLATISSGLTEWQLRLMDESGYPSLTTIEDPAYSVDRDEFAAALDRTRYAMASDAVRPSLQMVNIQSKKMRATDGHRYQEVSVGWWPDGFDFDIPALVVEELLKTLRDDDTGLVDIQASTHMLHFSIGGTDIFVKRPTKGFPPVDQATFKPFIDNNAPLLVDRAALLKAIKRVRVTADFLTNAVKLEIGNNKLTVSSKDRIGNQASETIDCTWEETKRTVAFHHKHLVDMVSRCTEDEC